MKTLIAILFVLVGAVGFAFHIQGNEVDSTNAVARSCKCENVLCACDITCDGSDRPKCVCKWYSCTCMCESLSVSADQALGALPVMTDAHKNNSTRIEQYFRGLNTSEGREIANYVRNLRDALLEKNLDKYRLNVQGIERVYDNASAQTRQNFESWLAANFKI